MSYFPDLSPYAYGHGSHPGVLHVGWLDDKHPFATGEVDVQLIDKLKCLALNPVELYRGLHICELCVEPPGIIKSFLPNLPNGIDPKCAWAQWIAGRASNGEIRISRAGIMYAAPVLIVHNIEAHRYLPPDEFLQAVQEAPCANDTGP